MGIPSSLTEKLIQANYPYTAHLIGGNLASTQWGDMSSVSTGYTSTNIMTVLSSTISWPGLDGEYIDEIECSLTANYYNTTASSKSTLAQIWQFKYQGESTWTNLTTLNTNVSTKSTNAVVHSGYLLHRDGTLANGYNRLPINLRLRAYTKKGSKVEGRIRVKGNSYLTFKTRKGNDVT